MGENPHTENPRFPEEGSSALGKSGPKARPRGVVDGQQVEIPVPYICEGMTERGSCSQRLEELVQARYRQMAGKSTIRNEKA